MKIVKMLLLAGFFMVSLFPVGRVAAKADDPIDSVISKVQQDGNGEVYIIKKGDTLWDLSEHFYLTPWQWPDLWRNNPEIMDPHWIYPGNKLIVFPREKKAPPAKPVDKPKPVVKVQEPAPRMIKIPQKNNFGPVLFALHTDNFPQVTGGVGENDWLVDGDRFFYHGQPEDSSAGARVKVLRYLDKVSLHGKKYRLYQEIAIAEIGQVDADGNPLGKLLCVQVPVGSGDRLVPFQAFPEKVQPQAGPDSLKVNVLAIEKERQLADFGSFVILDQGSSAGMENGSVFAAFDQDNDFWRNPSTEVYTDKYADVMVVRVFPDYSVGMVINLDLPFSSGVGLAGEHLDRIPGLLPQ